MLVTKVRRSGWSGWLVERALASPRAESADWAALMVAVTWSLPAGALMSRAAIWPFGAVVGSERTDIVRGL
jgi:hypothetical protein